MLGLEKTRAGVSEGIGARRALELLIGDRNIVGVPTTRGTVGTSRFTTKQPMGMDSTNHAAMSAHVMRRTRLASAATWRR